MVEATSDVVHRHCRARVAQRGGDPDTGSRFDDFLKAEGIYDEVQGKALKRALAESLTESMATTKLGKAEMARRIGASRSHLDLVLDPENTSAQLDTLIRAARAVSKVIDIKIKRQAKAA